MTKRFSFTLAEGATHVAMPNSKLNFGFTLAEVLITLGIIGVVAACEVSNPTDIYSVALYDQTVMPATNAANAVLYGK